MYLGKVCELATPDRLYAAPAHPYTAALLSSIPVPDPAAEPRSSGLVLGDLPSPVAPPSGCRFRTRCPRAEERCAVEQPHIREVAEGQFVACHFPLVGDVAPPADRMPVAEPVASGGNGAGAGAPGGVDSTPGAPAGAPVDAGGDPPAGDGSRAT
jgi:peptide/nickel transport system ATP-binding protein